MIEQQNLHICLVEPSGVQANIIIGLLKKIGITHVDNVKNGADAIKALDGDIVPDVVMSAMYLPDMTGSDLILAIRQHPSQSLTPFLLISSETNPHSLEAIRQAGTIAILPKPFSEAQLLRSVQNTLDFLNADEEQEDYGDLKLSTLRVLIVDDSKVARRHIRSVLERIGFEDFTEVSDGREAMPYIESILFDLVITDYNMPNVDGLALIDFIRTKSVQSSVPILMVSSVSDEERLAAVMDAGVSAICDKPFEINLVRNFIKRFLADEDGESL